MVFSETAIVRIVLNNINLEVGDGEFVCLLGPSGCGKSTLLSTMAGFLSPTGGDISIDGEAVRGPDPRRIFVFQERGVFPVAHRRRKYRIRPVQTAARGTRAAHRALRQDGWPRGIRERLPATSFQAA